MLSLERVVIATMETMATTSTMIAADPNSGTTAPFTISIMTSSVYCGADPCCALIVHSILSAQLSAYLHFYGKRTISIW